MAEEKKADVFLKLDGDNGFCQRADAIFGKLDSLEPVNITSEVANNDKEEDKPNFKRPTISGKGKGRALKRVPDHILHPAKWKKYSLEDDGTKATHLTGDALNKQVAVSFIQDLKKRKSTEVDKEEDMDIEEQCTKHIFSKPSLSTDNKVSKENPSSLSVGQGTKLVMPEYEVGKGPTRLSQKISKIKDNQMEASSKDEQKTPNLQHLGSEDKAEGEEESDAITSTVEKVEVKFAKRSSGKGRRSLRKRNITDE